MTVRQRKTIVQVVLSMPQTQVRTLSVGGVLDEQPFWQIVRTEKERADRSGVPVTVVVFTVGDHSSIENRKSGWNAATLCGDLRSPRPHFSVQR